MAKITWRNYYRRYFVQIGKQVRSDIVGLIVAFVIATAVQVLQVLHHVMQAQDFRPNLLSSFWPYTAAVVSYLIYAAFRAPVKLDRQRFTEIDERDNQLAVLRKAQEANPKAYTEGEIARLQWLIAEGRTLYETHISGSVQTTKQGLDNWISKHDDWRDKVVDILHDRDVAIFVRPETAGHQTIGRPGAMNDTHGNKRGQLLAELERLEKIINRNNE